MPGRHALLSRHARTPVPGRHCGRLAPAGPDPRLAAVPVAVGAVALAGVPAAAASEPANVREMAQSLHSTARSMGPANVAAAIPAYPLAAGSYFGWPIAHAGQSYADRLVSGYGGIGGGDPNVLTAQRRLLAHGGGLGAAGADGYFGTRTDQATRLFQQAQGLRVDGLVGPRTWAALWEAPETPVSTPSCSTTTRFEGYEPLRPHVKAAAQEIARLFCPRVIGGWRPGDSGEHPLGRAIDVMTYEKMAKGEAVAQYAIANATRLRVYYVIWNRRIWIGGAWKAYSGPSPHTDHAHLSHYA